LDIGSFTPFIGVLIFSYGFFTFFSQRMNPFVKLRKRKSDYRKVVYFRYVAVALFLSATLALFIKSYFFLSLPVAASVGAIAFALSIISPSLRYYRVKRPHNSDSVDTTNQKQPLADIEHIEEKPLNIHQYIAIQEMQALTSVKSTDVQESELQRSSNPQKNQIQLHRDTVPTLHKNTPDESPHKPDNELLEKSSSEEYAVEMAIKRATAHIDVNLTDFDQSITEADFEAVLSSGSQTTDAAQPDFSGTAKGDSTENDHELTYARTTANPGPANRSLSGSLSASDNSTSSTDRISLENARQTQLIEALELRNQSLSNANETLIGEISRLELGVKQRNAALRKNIALKKQAIEVKNKALSMAAMERKRRKLTEIRARTRTGTQLG